MEFKTNAAPYIRAKRSTLHIMLALCIALAVVWVFAIIYNFRVDAAVKAANLVKEVGEGEDLTTVAVTTSYGIKAIFNVIVAVVVSVLCDFVISVIKQGKKGKIDWKEVAHYCIHNYSYVTGIIFALTLPVYTNFYLIIIGALFATLICKNCFGGFGKNVFNPAIMARILIGLCFGAKLGAPEALTLLAASEAPALYTVDAITGATVTTTFNNVSSWLRTSVASGVTTVKDGVLVNGLSTMDILLGNYMGALGETFTIVILVLGIALSVLKVINWRTPVFYIGTVAVTALVIALISGIDPVLYIVAHIGLGGLAFGAVFMLTDPVTGPSSNYGKTIAAIFAGFLTVLIRIKGGYPEGVMYSIAMANLISPAIDTLIKGRTNEHLGRKYGFTGGLLVVAVAACTLIACASPVQKKAVDDKTGLSYAEDAKLLEIYTPEVGHYEKLVDYEAKTDKLAEFIFAYEDEEKGIEKDALSKAYKIVDGDNVVAYGYTIKDKYSIERVIPGQYSDAPQEVTCTAFIVISNDGKLLAFNALTEKGPSTGGNYRVAADSMLGEFIGKDAAGCADPALDAINGLSNSPKFIKLLIADAFAEFNAQ